MDNETEINRLLDNWELSARKGMGQIVRIERVLELYVVFAIVSGLILLGAILFNW